MFFFRISIVVLMIFHNGETVNGQTNANMIELYNNVLNVDTGYPKETHNDLEEITENSVAVAKEKLYGNLLCSYVFTCQYYMHLIKNLVDRASEGFFKTAFQYDMINATYFQNQIVTMLFVLKHFGSVSSSYPLWLMYAYIDCLKVVATLVSQHNIRNGILIKYDHDFVYRSLTNFANNNCRPYNMYNHQYYKSDYFKELKKLDFPDKNADTLLGILFTDIIETTDTRHTNIRQSFGIDNISAYFVIDNLCLSHIMLDEDTMKLFLEDFAEAKNTPNAHKTIQQFCSSNPLKFVSVRSLVVEVGGFLGIFVNLIKYIVARQAFKYILDVHSSLPVSENRIQSPEEFKQWIFHSNIRTNNETMFNNFQNIINFLKIDEDNDLKFIVEIFNSAPHITFGDPMKNTENENRIENMLVNFSNELPLLPSLRISRADFDPSYKSQRKAEALNLAKRLKVDEGDLNGNHFEGMLDLFVFKVYITRQYGDTNFEFVHSFFEFQRNYFIDYKNVYTSK